MLVSTFPMLVRLQAVASALYSIMKSLSRSSSLPEKYGALFERGPGIVDTPEVAMAGRVGGRDVSGRNGDK